jgi:hypothetical protein
MAKLTIELDGNIKPTESINIPMSQLRMQAAAAVFRIDFDIGCELSCISKIRQGNIMRRPNRSE